MSKIYTLSYKWALRALVYFLVGALFVFWSLRKDMSGGTTIYNWLGLKELPTGSIYYRLFMVGLGAVLIYISIEFIKYSKLVITKSNIIRKSILGDRRINWEQIEEIRTIKRYRGGFFHSCTLITKSGEEIILDYVKGTSELLRDIYNHTSSNVEFSSLAKRKMKIGEDKIQKKKKDFKRNMKEIKKRNKQKVKRLYELDAPIEEIRELTGLSEVDIKNIINDINRFEQ